MRQWTKFKPEPQIRFGMSCVKSDNFRPKRPENPSRRPFSAVSGQNVGASKGTHPPEGGLSNGAGMSGGLLPHSRDNVTTSLARRAFGGGIYREGKSLSLKF